jgi:hypothetical protein
MSPIRVSLADPAAGERWRWLALWRKPIED